MHCVILAAGKGTRMRPLTDTTPKPLIPVCGKPILDHIVEALPSAITEIILVTNYLEDQIKAHCGDEFYGRKVTYVTQDKPAGGTGAALMCVRDIVTERFLFMYADDLHGLDALARVCTKEHAVLAMKTDNPQSFGILSLNPDGTLHSMVEKPDPVDAPSDLANISGWVISPDIFDYEVELSPRGEFEATDMITAYAADHPVQVVEQDTWIPIGSPEQLAKAEEVLCPEKLLNRESK